MFDITFDYNDKGIILIEKNINQKILITYDSILKEIKLKGNPLVIDIDYDLYLDKRFIIKKIKTGYFICDLILKKYIYISKVKIEKILEKEQIIKETETKKDEIEEKIRKAIRAKEDFIYILHNAKNRFYYSLQSSNKVGYLDQSFGLEPINSFEFIKFLDKWTLDRKFKLFNKDEPEWGYDFKTKYCDLSIYELYNEFIDPLYKIDLDKIYKNNEPSLKRRKINDTKNEEKNIDEYILFKF